MCVYRIRDGKTGNLKLFFPLFLLLLLLLLLLPLFFLKRAAPERKRETCVVEKFLILKIHQKQQLFFGCSMRVRHFSIAMKRELKMNTQNTCSGVYLCVHFQRYLCAHVEDMGTKRERFLAPESRERRETCVFEFLKKRRGEKKFKKNSKTHNRRSLSSLDFLLTTKQRNFTVLLRADDRVKIHSQTSNDIRNQFSKDQIQQAVDKELL